MYRLRVFTIRLKYMGLAVNKGFTTSFFDLPSHVGFDTTLK
jgi:hypothetical protein